MLILILIDVQYLLNVAFILEKDSCDQNHYWSDLHQLSKISLSRPPGEISPTP